MKKLLTILLVFVVCISCVACSTNNTNHSTPSNCTHIYSSATCTSPQKCTKCGTTKGSALGHNYKAATCTTPKKCTRCSQTTGSVLGHATSTGICNRCNERIGWTKSEVQNTIKVYAIWVEEINSVGGVDIGIGWKNTSNKTIKYIHFYVEPYNTVGDMVSCEIRGHSLFRAYATGPFEPGYDCYSETTGSYGGIYRYGMTWSNCWYNNTARVMKLCEIRIEYMDGSELTIDEKFVDYAFSS